MSSSTNNSNNNNDSNLEFVNQIVANSNQSDVDAAVAAITSAAKHNSTNPSAASANNGSDSGAAQASVDDIAAIAAAAQAVGSSAGAGNNNPDKKPVHAKILPRISPEKHGQSPENSSEAAGFSETKFKAEEALKDSQIERIIESVASSAAAATAAPQSDYKKKSTASEGTADGSHESSADRLAADINSIANAGKDKNVKTEAKSERHADAHDADFSRSSASDVAPAAASAIIDDGTQISHPCSRCKRAFQLSVGGKVFKLCPHCRELQRQRSKRWQQKTREKDGVCRRCGKGIPEEESKFVLCSKCRTTLRDKKSNRAELGKCVHCSGPNDPNSQFKVCQRCRNNDKSRRTRLEKDGLCNRCAKPLSQQDKGNYKVCSNCRTRKKRSVDEPTVVVLANSDSKAGVPADMGQETVETAIGNPADIEKSSRKKQKTSGASNNDNNINSKGSANSAANSGSDNDFIVAQRIVQQLQSAAQQAAQVAAQAAKQQEEILSAEGHSISKTGENESKASTDAAEAAATTTADDANNLFMQPEAVESIKKETVVDKSDATVTTEVIAETATPGGDVDTKDAAK